MNEFAQGIAHGVGYTILWSLGLIGIPILVAIVSIIIFRVEVDSASWVWGVTLFLYLVGSGLFLVML